MVLNLKAVVSTLGALVFFLGVAMLLPMFVGIFYGEAAWWSFGTTAAGAMVLGATAWRSLGGVKQEMRVREGFTIVALSWFVLSLVGALPFVLSGTLGTFTDGFFETMSGFTTTGASILGGGGNPNIEEVSKAILFWRSLTHWLGGMGIIVLTLAILPILGVGGMQLFRAEVPGPSTDKLTPRVRETAKRLWLIYVGITAVQVLLLLPAMSFFDAVNHAFATMSTGGFSTRNASVGQYDSAYIDGVITVFMFLGGMNFALHYRLLRGRSLTVFKDTELKVYAAICLAATLLVTLGTWHPVARVLPGTGIEYTFEGYPSFTQALRFASFQVVSIITTTGFATVDYEIWPPLALGVIFLLFFTGGMAGSTGGGVKIVRHILVYKNSFRELRQLIHPQAVMPVRLNAVVVPNEIMRNVLSFIVLYIASIAIGTAFMSLLGLDLLSAVGAAITSVGNIGPAFGTFGPTENFAHVPASGKWVLAMLMMAGRLEIFTVLILFMPTFWRR